MTASIPHGSLRHRSLHVIFGVILILSLHEAHSAAAEEEHTHAVFQDDFEDWDEGAWDVYIPADASYGTSWKVLDDDGNKVLSLKGTMWVGAGDPDWTDYTLTVRVKLVDVPEEEEARICVRLGHEGGRRYLVSVPQQDPAFSKQYGGEFSNLAKVEMVCGDGAWHVFKIVCIGGEFWVYVDDELKMEYVDEDDPFLSGYIGFECGPHTNAYFDDVRVTVTHVEYIKQLIEEAEVAIDEARIVEADVVEAESMLEEARNKLTVGDLLSAERLSGDAALKAIASREDKVSATQEQPSDAQQPSPAQSSGGLSIERVATLITIGGAAIGAVGWMFRTRGIQRRRAILFRELMQGVEDTYNRFRTNAGQCEAELYRLKDRAIMEFKQGLITEENYGVLDGRIEEYIGRVKEENEE